MRFPRGVCEVKAKLGPSRGGKSSGEGASTRWFMSLSCGIASHGCNRKNEEGDIDDIEEGDEKEEKRQLRERRMKKRSKDGDGLLRSLVVPLPEQLVATFGVGVGVGVD